MSDNDRKRQKIKGRKYIPQDKRRREGAHRVRTNYIRKGYRVDTTEQTW
jgi:hypothetical protein